MARASWSPSGKTRLASPITAGMDPLELPITGEYRSPSPQSGLARTAPAISASSETAARGCRSPQLVEAH